MKQQFLFCGRWLVVVLLVLVWFAIVPLFDRLRSARDLEEPDDASRWARELEYELALLV